MWALDYQFDVTSTGRTIKILHVVDEYNRESLADLVASSIDADATVALVLGSGRRLLPEKVHMSLRLTDSVVTPSGVVIAIYERFPADSDDGLFDAA